LLASGSSDQSVRLWDSTDGHLLSVLRGHGDEVWSLAFTPDGKLVSVDKQGAMLLWDLPKPGQPDLNSQIAAIVGPRIFSPDSRTMATGLYLFASGRSVETALLAAASLIMTAPVIVFYLLFQRRFVRGVTAGALRG